MMILKNRIGIFFKRWRFLLFAKDAIRTFAALARENRWDYFITYGTLLGAYREHHFIKHDDDIDIAVNNKNLSISTIEIMRDAGFHLKAIFITNDKAYKHICFYYKGITFDLYGFNRENEKIVQFEPIAINNNWKYSLDINKFAVSKTSFKDEGMQSIIFEKAEVMIPTNSKDFLEGLYGKTFMTPIKYTAGNIPRSSISEHCSIDSIYAKKITIEEL